MVFEDRDVFFTANALLSPAIEVRNQANKAAFSVNPSIGAKKGFDSTTETSEPCCTDGETELDGTYCCDN